MGGNKRGNKWGNPDKRRTRIATQKRKCPKCRAPLVGIVWAAVCRRGGDWRAPETTEWLCESCDTEFVQTRPGGLITTREHDEREERKVTAEVLDEMKREFDG